MDEGELSRVVERLRRLVEGKVETRREGVDSLSSSRTLSLSEVGERGVACK